jgi:hypothetical protein
MVRMNLSEDSVSSWKTNSSPQRHLLVTRPCPVRFLFLKLEGRRLQAVNIRKLTAWLLNAPSRRDSGGYFEDWSVCVQLCSPLASAVEGIQECFVNTGPCLTATPCIFSRCLLVPFSGLVRNY